MVEQSPRVRLIHSVQTPLNDALHIFAELGLVGLLLIVLPIGYLLIQPFGLCKLSRLSNFR